MSEKKNTEDEKPIHIRKRAALPVYIILAVIIIGQLIYTVYCFNYKKDGFNIDEPWSYGLANSYYKPFLFVREGVPLSDAKYSDLEGFNEWLDGSVFKNYITVQPGERFAYGSVFSNQMLDFHPPFFYMILHTICSFFPNQFSFMYGFVINCVCLVLTTLFLFKVSALMTEDGVKALVPTALYAASTGALSTFLFIRQYSVITALMMMTIYYTASFFYRMRREGECRLTAVIPIAVTSFLAFFTHYCGIMFLGILTAVICLWLLFHKKIKAMFVYGGSVLAALGLFLAIFPAALRHIFFVGGSAELDPDSLGVQSDLVLPYRNNFRLCLSYTLRYSVGLKVTVMDTNTSNYVFAAVFCIVLICVPLCFLFRREKWFAAIKAKVGGAGAAVLNSVRHADAMFIGMALGVMVSVLIISRQSDFYAEPQTTARYVFPFFPIVCAAVVFFIYKVIRLIPHAERFTFGIAAVMAAAALVRMHIMWPCKFFFSEAGNEAEVRKSLAGKNCLVILYENALASPITCFPTYLENADKAYFTQPENLDKQLDEIAEEQVDDIFVFNYNYTFTEEQFAQLKALYEKYGSEVPEYAFKHDGIRDMQFSGLESEKFYEMYPREQFEPKYVINVNLGICVVLERKEGAS